MDEKQRLQNSLFFLKENSRNGTLMTQRRYERERDRKLTLPKSTLSQKIGGWNAVGQKLNLSTGKPKSAGTIKDITASSRPPIKASYQEWFENHQTLHIDFEFIALIRGGNPDSWRQQLKDSHANGSLYSEGWRFEISEDGHVVTCVARPNANNQISEPELPDSQDDNSILERILAEIKKRPTHEELKPLINKYIEDFFS